MTNTTAPSNPVDTLRERARAAAALTQGLAVEIAELDREFRSQTDAYSAELQSLTAELRPLEANEGVGERILAVQGAQSSRAAAYQVRRGDLEQRMRRAHVERCDLDVLLDDAERAATLTTQPAGKSSMIGVPNNV